MGEKVEYVVNEILQEIKSRCDIDTYTHLSNFITVKLNGYRLEKNESGIVKYEMSKNEQLFKMFFISKKLQGLSDRSLKYYKQELEKSLLKINKPFEQITSDDIKYFLACYQLGGTANATSIDNVRRVLNTFFQWLEDEEYIVKNPVKKIKKIKQEKKIKKAFTFDEIEKIKLSCKTKREIAIIEFLLSTGVRADELVNSKLIDLDIETGQLKVLGKGNKERTVYLNSSAKVRLLDYLSDRTGNNDYIFSGEISPYDKIGTDRLRTIIKRIGKRAGIDDVHPHRFRRTCATIASKRGMKIEEIQKMLGHENLTTTQIYVQVDDVEIKKSHEKYMN